MKHINLIFQVHQPYRLRNFNFFEIGGKHQDYFDDELNRKVMERVAKNAYGPTNELLLRAIQKYGAMLKVNFSISGTAIDQLGKYDPKVLNSFKQLAKTRNVEFIGQTFSNSLASIQSRMAFIQGTKLHSERMLDIFGLQPKVFLNTGLSFSNEMYKIIKTMGFYGFIANGSDFKLKGQSPNTLYKTATQQPLKLLFKNRLLSEDIAHRFGQKDWDQWPLTSEKYVNWLKTTQLEEKVINLVIDYAVFGEHHKKNTGIFDFLDYLILHLVEDKSLRMSRVSEVFEIEEPIASVEPFDSKLVHLALQNDLQQDAFQTLLNIGRKLRKSTDETVKHDWLRLQSIDHFLYMDDSDGNPFNPYESPYEAFLRYMNVLADFDLKVSSVSKNKPVRVKHGKTKARKGS